MSKADSGIVPATQDKAELMLSSTLRRVRQHLGAVIDQAEDLKT
jgi:hypothetical protein